VFTGSERYSSRGGRGEHSNSYKRPRVRIQIEIIFLFIKFIYYLFITYLLDDKSKISIKIANILKVLDISK